MRTRSARRTVHGPLIALGALLLLAAPAAAQDADLARDRSVVVGGEAAGGGAGSTIAACDVNGDGRDDIVVGDTRGGNNGRAYVVFGRPGVEPADLGDLGGEGLVIEGESARDQFGFSVGCAGDVDGDGLEDITVGAWLRNGKGTTYVLFGRSEPGTIAAGDIAGAGFRIEAEADGDRLGVGDQNGGEGDVNGDGFDDVVVGALGNDEGGATAGAAYVVFGGPGSDDVELAELGGRGFKVAGAAGNDRAGYAVAIGGDMNADGRDEVLVSSYTAGRGGESTTGEAAVVFGRTGPDTVRLAELGDAGFLITNPVSRERLGIAISSAGDVDGDGRADVLVGADGVPATGAPRSGRAHVVYGKADATPVDVSTMPVEQGYTMNGVADGDHAGFAVAAVDDVDGDGRAEALIGAYDASPRGREGAGAAYVVYGRATDVDLAALTPDDGYTVDGAAPGDRLGRDVAGLSTFTGAGRPDIALGADSASALGRESSGAVFVPFVASPPTVRGGEGQATAPSSAEVSGRAVPNREQTTTLFELTASGQPIVRTAQRQAGDGFGEVGAFERVQGLAPDTQYTVRLVATNASGETAGEPFTLRTPAQPAPAPGSSSQPAQPAPSPTGSTAPSEPGATSPPASDDALGAPRFPAKLQVARARVDRDDRDLDVLAPITARASGSVVGSFRAAGRTSTFTTDVDRENRRVRFRDPVSRAAAELGTGILTMRYPGNDRTRPQEVRLRAAANPSELEPQRPRIDGGRLLAEGTIVDAARGVVRLDLTWTQRDGAERTLARTVEIGDGRWSLDEALGDEVLASLGDRRGTVDSVIAFTGLLPQRLRGEVHTFQVAGPPGSE
ncbi:MAG: hypothetical protein MSC31_09550 [Solirubrobacteraceae bacterium MAG38_C4-C5]|nr:hypothetical protein [Candidatus Siliceabacter maunaloa]